MSVKINIPSYFQYFTYGNNVVEVSDDSVVGCLKELAEKYPEIGKLLFNSEGELFNHSLNQVAIFINGVAIHPDEMTREVNDGDVVDLSYVILGG